VVCGNDGTAPIPSVMIDDVTGLVCLVGDRRRGGSNAKWKPRLVKTKGLGRRIHRHVVVRIWIAHNHGIAQFRTRRGG